MHVTDIQTNGQNFDSHYLASIAITSLGKIAPFISRFAKYPVCTLVSWYCVHVWLLSSNCIKLSTCGVLWLLSFSLLWSNVGKGCICLAARLQPTRLFLVSAKVKHVSPLASGTFPLADHSRFLISNFCDVYIVLCHAASLLCESQKHPQYCSFITLPYVGWFSKFFQHWIEPELCNKTFMFSTMPYIHCYPTSWNVKNQK